MLSETGWIQSLRSTSRAGKLQTSSLSITPTSLACFPHSSSSRSAMRTPSPDVTNEISLQISDHKNVGSTNSTSIKLFCHVQSALAEQVQLSQANIKVRSSQSVVLLTSLLQGLPSEQNEAMCRVCRTFCLACLQNNFPAGKLWGK